MINLILSSFILTIAPIFVFAALPCHEDLSIPSLTSSRWPGLPAGFLPRGASATSIQIRTNIADALVRSGYQAGEVVKLVMSAYGDISPRETINLPTFNPQNPRVVIFNSEDRPFWIWIVDELDTGDIVRGRLLFFIDDSTNEVVKYERVF